MTKKPLKIDVLNANAGQSRPAMVMVHGGSWIGGHRGEIGKWNEWLAAKGYVVFDIDYRLAPPPTWQAAPGDVKCALGWVAAHANELGVDPQSISLFGNSAGAHLALLAGYSSKQQIPPSCDAPEVKVKQVIAIAPPTDLTTLYNYPYPKWYPSWLREPTDIPTFVGATPIEAPERYQTTSVLSHANAKSPRTLLLHGTQDQLVPPSQSTQLAEKLDHVHTPYTYRAIHGSNHGFEFMWHGWGSQQARQAIEDFLQAK